MFKNWYYCVDHDIIMIILMTYIVCWKIEKALRNSRNSKFKNPSIHLVVCERTLMTVLKIVFNTLYHIGVICDGDDAASGDWWWRTDGQEDLQVFILLLKVPLWQYVHIIISLYNNIVILLCIIIKTGPIVTCIIESIAKNTMTHVNVSRVRHGTKNETGRSAI